jgi:hypothetical protein
VDCFNVSGSRLLAAPWSMFAHGEQLAHGGEVRPCRKRQMASNSLSDTGSPPGISIYTAGSIL